MLLWAGRKRRVQQCVLCIDVNIGHFHSLHSYLLKKNTQEEDQIKNKLIKRQTVLFC